MLRWTTLLIAVTACARSGPPPARLFAEGQGGCPDPAGCEVATGEEIKYAPPDGDHDPPEEPYLGPAEIRDATCTDVGIATAAIEVGNYATEAERAPVARKYRARCVKARLDATERQCVFEAADATTVAYCAPRFWPQSQVLLVDPLLCGEIANQIRGQMNALPDAPPGQALWDRQLGAVLQSCQQDRWTVAFAECAATMRVPDHVAPYCQHAAPPPLLAKLQDRMAKVK